jgi:hypothetical protein
MVKWLVRIDIGGHGSNGSLINMVYNTYYGMDYNNSTLIEPKFGMNSYSTQVAQLHFEYIWIRQNIMSEIFMLYQSILDLGISHVGNSHKRQNSAIAILWNKCDNNYSYIVYITLKLRLGFMNHWVTQLTHLLIE